jgi:nicotinamidase-related amidase
MGLPAESQNLAEKGFARPIGFGLRPAVLVVDFINAFTDPSSALGSDVDAAIGEANRLILAARRHGLTVYFSTIRYEEANCADAGLWLTKIAGLSVLSAGSDGSMPDRRLLIEPQDPVIVKKFASCFFGTDLLTRLFRDKIDTLVLSGCTTSGCVRASAVDACQYGIHAIVAREAVADRLEGAHRQSLIDIELKYGDVLPVEKILATFDGIAASRQGWQ